jgi:hypothetical protein
VKIKSQKDFWAGLMFVVVGAGFAVGATNYTFGSSAHPGPGYFPLGLGALLALLGAAVLFAALSIETVDGDPVGPWAFKPLLVLMVSVGLFGLLLPRLGLLLALPLLVLMSSLAGLTAGAWLVFIKGLELVIPVWPRFVSP